MDINLNASCTCSHCHLEIGSLNELVGGVSHECFLQYDEISFDYETNIVKGVFKRSENPKDAPSTTSGGVTNWTDPAIKLLISMYKECEEAFSSPQHNKKTVWGKISQKLEEHGIQMTARKCDEKWRNLKKKYDSVRRENEKTGNASSNWRFFNELHSIYSKDPLFSPLSTVSSTGKIIMQQQLETPTSSRSKFSPTGLDVGITPKRIKRKCTTSMEELEKKRQARHDEKMKFKREVFEWLKASDKKDPSSQVQ